MSSPPPDTAAPAAGRTALRSGPTAVAAVPLVLGLVLFDVALDAWAAAPLVAAALLLGLLGGRRSGRAATLLAAAALLLAGTYRLHVAWESRQASRSDARIAARLQDLEQGKDELVQQVRALGQRVASSPDCLPALSGDSAALVRLFAGMGDRRRETRRETGSRPSVAVHSYPGLVVKAWSGRLGEPTLPSQVLTRDDDVFVLEGTVTTTLVATVAVRGADGSVRGLVTASLPIAVRRGIDNEYLRDFDLLTGEDPRVEALYVDVRDGVSPSGFPPLDPALHARDAVLRAPDGDPLVRVRVVSPGIPEVREVLSERYRRVLAALAALALAAWAAGLGGGPWVVAAAVAGGRLAWAAVGAPWPSADAAVLSPEVYISLLLGPFTRSPLDFGLTALAVLVAVACAFVGVLRREEAAPATARPLLGILLGALGPALACVIVADTVAHATLDLESVALAPATASHVALQLGLLAWALAGVLWVGVCLPLAGLHPRLLRWLQGARPGARAAAGLATVAATGALLSVSLTLLGQRDLRQRIATQDAPLVLRQPDARELVLAETRKQIDSLRLLTDDPPGRARPGIEELAFAVWAATDLAVRGFSSALEIQDASGAVVSRFALNLPTLSSRDLPSNENWKVSLARSSLASTAHSVLYARRLLVEDGHVRGAVHVYVADDFWNLPFLRSTDPYSLLYRPAPRVPSLRAPLTLVAYGRDEVRFTSVERAPAIPSPLWAGLAPGGPGRWTVTDIDGQPHHAYLFRGPDASFVLAYPRAGWGRRVADLVEAVAAFTVAALLALVTLVAARSALGRRELSLRSILRAVQRRFATRLFVAFTVLAVVPVAVLELVVRKFVADRLWEESNKQALERASVAKKAIEDYAYLQEGEPAGVEPVSDRALVWVSSLIRNDLDVFERGRLVASSKRELYSSGLLAPRVSGAVYSALVLEGQPSILRTERIGDFSYLVASLQVRLAEDTKGVLSIPLAPRQRQVEATVDDLDRLIRLASLVFLGLAALFAHSVARRISGPISALTAATRRVAEGDLETRVAAVSRDELQTLVDSFNHMAGDLDRQRRDLERSNRLATWADMARQVAHEVKNPLTPIQLSAEHLRRVWRDRRGDFDGALEACTTTILQQVATLREIVTEFSAFARPPAAVPEAQAPLRLVEEVLAPYRTALPPGVALSVAAEDDLPTIDGDRRLLGRAVLNLVENALQAVGDAGRIDIGLRSSEDGRRVELTVTDSGPGIDPALVERVFEPFFSTKSGGSGLGLPLVRKIVEDHGGGVALARMAEGGTRALLWLPARRRETAA
ncbi:MAG: ATP-binding protein [Vicinamibacteria bacterium]